MTKRLSLFLITKNRILLSQTFLALSIIWVWPLLLFIFLVRRFLIIRFCPLTSGRIGDSITDFVEHDLSKYLPKSVTARYMTFYYFETRTFPNSFWKNYMKRNLCISGEWARQVDFWIKKLKFMSMHHLNTTSTNSRDVNGHIAKINYELTFTPQEDGFGKNWLVQNGWKEGQKIISLHIRDETFLLENPVNAPLPGDDRWSYHNFRNSDIESYVPAINWLIEKGFFVIRMGRLAKQKATISDSSFVDLPFLTKVDDFLDIWLIAKSCAHIGTYSGIDHAAVVNRLPILFLNALPLAEIFSYTKMMWVPKTLLWKFSNEKMLIREHLESAWLHRSEYYLEKGIAIVDLSATEVLSYVKEFILWLERDFVIDYKDLALVEQFWAVFKSWENFHILHDWIHPKALPSILWLRDNMKGW